MDSHQQQFCLKWNSFGSNLATAFSNLFKSESLTDVTLFCEGKSRSSIILCQLYEYIIRVNRKRENKQKKKEGIVCRKTCGLTGDPLRISFENRRAALSRTTHFCNSQRLSPNGGPHYIYSRGDLHYFTRARNLMTMQKLRYITTCSAAFQKTLSFSQYIMFLFDLTRDLSLSLLNLTFK